jgi:hypothetical protein
MAIQEMREHINLVLQEVRTKHFPLDDDLHVHWIDNRHNAEALGDQDPCEIWIPRIQCDEDYATCLHEIGHIVGRFQKSKNVMIRERWAWRWAQDNAAVWTDAMERDRKRSLRWYRRHNPKKILPVAN